MLQSVKRHLIPPYDDVTSVDVAASSIPSISHPDQNDSSTSDFTFASTSMTSSAPSGFGPSSSSAVQQPVSRSKIEEVLHWLEQIFLEKFSQSTPRSPPISSLSSPLHLSAGDLDHQQSET